jgi:NitT/TauT family transport system substrate-binding protein
LNDATKEPVIMTNRRFALRTPILTAIFFALVSLALAACGQASPERPQTTTPVRLQLAWTHEYSSAPFYAAVKNGHYASEGLDVELLAGGFGENGYIEPTTQVLDGSVDFGIVASGSLIQARANGQPLVGIASVFQRNPTAILSRSESAIQRPEDLIGRRVMVADGGAIQLLDAFIKAQGLDRNAIEILPRTSYGIEPLLNNEVDALVGWVINEGVLLREAGIEPNMMLFSDYGIDSYPMVIFATEKTLAERPELVQHFVRATLQGMEDMIADPDTAAGLALSYDTTLDLDGQRRRLHASLPLFQPAGTRLGMMQPEIWQMTEQFMLDDKSLGAAVDLSKVYTLTFLPDDNQARTSIN